MHLRRRGRAVAALAVAAVLVIAAVVALVSASGRAAPVTARVVRIPVVDGPRDNQHVVLDATFFTPEGGGRVPAILLAHGFGETKNAVRPQALAAGARRIRRAHLVRPRLRRLHRADRAGLARLRGEGRRAARDLARPPAAGPARSSRRPAGRYRGRVLRRRDRAAGRRLRPPDRRHRPADHLEQPGDGAVPECRRDRPAGRGLQEAVGGPAVHAGIGRLRGAWLGGLGRRGRSGPGGRGRPRLGAAAAAGARPGRRPEASPRRLRLPPPRCKPPSAAASCRRSARSTSRSRPLDGPRRRPSRCCCGPVRPAWPAGSTSRH